MSSAEFKGEGAMARSYRAGQIMARLLSGA